MNDRSICLRRILLMLTPVVALPAVALAQCPSKGDLEKALEPLSKGEKLEIKKIGPSPVKGLCEVQFKGNRGYGVVYVDEKGDFFFSGEIIDVKNRKSLTRELMTELNAPAPLAAADLQKAASLAAIAVGKGEKVVYFVTDPM